MDEKKKVHVRIKSRGMLNSFGYKGMRTPADVDLFESQLIILQAQGVDYEIIPTPEKKEMIVEMVTPAHVEAAPADDRRERKTKLNKEIDQ